MLSVLINFLLVLVIQGSRSSMLPTTETGPFSGFVLALLLFFFFLFRGRFFVHWEERFAPTFPPTASFFSIGPLVSVFGLLSRVDLGGEPLSSFPFISAQFFALRFTLPRGLARFSSSVCRSLFCFRSESFSPFI